MPSDVINRDAVGHLDRARLFCRLRYRSPGRVLGRDLDLPAGEDQVRVVEGTAAAHVVTGVLLPDLRPRVLVAEVVLCDLRERVAADHDVRDVIIALGRSAGLVRPGIDAGDATDGCGVLVRGADVEPIGIRYMIERTRLADAGRQCEVPAGLDECRVDETLTVVHHLAEVQIEDRIRDLVGPVGVGARVLARDPVDRLAALHGVGPERDGCAGDCRIVVVDELTR